MSESSPTSRQRRQTRAVVRWYLETHYGRDSDVGLLPTFCSRRTVGHMAVDASEIARGEDEALFRLFVTVAMFQVLRDALVMNILRGLTAEQARELTTPAVLAVLASTNECPHSRSNEALLSACGLTKNPTTKLGTCPQAPETPCYLKGHTEILRRYGHFGKVPTSAALVIRDVGGGRISGIYEQVIASVQSSDARARKLEQELSRTWRVNDKMASMFLSLVTAPDLGLESPPWRHGIDWTWYVVVDRNVDKFLAMIGYDGASTYAARREFVRSLARRIDLSEFLPGLTPFNPRLVQQAMYLFMSTSNRKASEVDCSHSGFAACALCPGGLRAICPLAHAPTRAPRPTLLP